MRQLSATEAARRFADVLDRVEDSGESFVVVRRGQAVATIGPTATRSGRDLKRALTRKRPDRDWSDELRGLRESLGPQTDRWND